MRVQLNEAYVASLIRKQYPQVRMLSPVEEYECNEVVVGSTTPSAVWNPVTANYDRYLYFGLIDGEAALSVVTVDRALVGQNDLIPYTLDKSLPRLFKVASCGDANLTTFYGYRVLVAWPPSSAVPSPPPESFAMVFAVAQGDKIGTLDGGSNFVPDGDNTKLGYLVKAPFAAGYGAGNNIRMTQTRAGVTVGSDLWECDGATTEFGNLVEGTIASGDHFLIEFLQAGHVVAVMEMDYVYPYAELPTTPEGVLCGINAGAPIVDAGTVKFPLFTYTNDGDPGTARGASVCSPVVNSPEPPVIGLATNLSLTEALMAGVGVAFLPQTCYARPSFGAIGSVSKYFFIATYAA